MMSYVTGENFTYDSLNNEKQGNDFALRQAFIEGGNVFPIFRIFGSGPASATTSAWIFISTISTTST
jgi:hypothetical protein